MSTNQNNIYLDIILVSIKGYAGGGMYYQSGVAAEYVCLPHDPNLIMNAVSSNPYNSYLWSGI